MCLFCDIINNKTNSYKIYEDENIIAILDIFPSTLGHSLIIPKKHFDDYLDVDLETLNNINVVIKKLSSDYLKKLSCKGFNIITNCRKVAGQTVNHLHFHLIPRYSENDNFAYKTTTKMIENPEKILELIKNN